MLLPSEPTDPSWARNEYRQTGVYSREDLAGRREFHPFLCWPRSKVSVRTKNWAPLDLVRTTKSPAGSMAPEGAEQGRSSGVALSTVTIQIFPARARILRLNSCYCQASSDKLLPLCPPLTAWKIIVASISASCWVRCGSGMGVQPGLAHKSLQIKPPIFKPGRQVKICSGVTA